MLFSVKQASCTVCSSNGHRPYIVTSTMMHTSDDEALFEFAVCDTCESVFLTNPVDESQLSEFYTDYYLPYRGASAWGKYSRWVEWDDATLNNKRANICLSEIGLSKKNINILDIGCGKPDFLATIAENNSVNATGVDFKSAQWELSKYANLTLIEGDWKTVSFSSKFDVITAWHYFEHDYQLKETVERCYDLLKPEGIIVIEVPMYQGILQKIQQKHWQGWHTPRHLTLFSIKSWKFLFPSKKWKIKKHQRYGTLSAFTLWWLGFKEKQKINWSISMENQFWELVFFKILLFPIFLFERILPMGVQLLVIQKKSDEL